MNATISVICYKSKTTIKWRALINIENCIRWGKSVFLRKVNLNQIAQYDE